MRAVETEQDTLNARAGSRPGTRPARLRRSRLRALALEKLEERALMATVPGAQVALQPLVAASGGNQSSPSIAVNPTNPSQLVAVWTRLDPNLAPGPTVVAGGAYSTNAGVTWNSFTPVSILTDPTSSATSPAPYAQTTDLSVAFDRSNNFYVLASEHGAGGGAGTLLLNKFSITNPSSPVIANESVFASTTDAGLKPMLAVDDNLPTFSDTDSNGNTYTQTDPGAGNVYVAWATNTPAPSGAVNWNPNTIQMIASGDGGLTFSPPRTVNAGGNFGSQRETSPQLAISQGSPGVPGGQVTVVYDDFGTGATATPTPFDILKVNHTLAPTVLTFNAAPGPIAVAPSGGSSTSTFNISVNPATSPTLSDLAVRLDLVHPNVGNLTINLIDPNNNVIPLASGLSGTAMGLGTGGKLYDTVLDPFAAIGIANGAAPYIGTFRPTGNLGTYVNQPLISGTWQIQIISTDTNNAGSVLKAALVATSSLSFNSETQAVTTTVRGAQGVSYPTASAASPLGIGPGAVIASDNTLGAYSQYQGRLYLAYVDRSTANGNPADNTNIELLISDDGGNTWKNPSSAQPRSPQIVNDDVAVTDGFSEGGTATSGRAQFEPAVAVDRSTGTLVITYFDGRYDAARARVATTIAASIDGGSSFGPQNFANAPLQAHDQATGQTVTIGPVLDNESGGNSATGADRSTFAFGDRQGLAVLDGHVYPAWSSNANGGNDGKQLLDIRVADATIAGGPRVIASTMGPVETQDPNPLLPSTPINTATAPDGTPLAQSFYVTFDRRVDPSTFAKTDVQVFFHDTTTNNATGQAVTVTGVTPVNSNRFGATQFRVDFQPSSGVGTYSYSIGPAVQDRIRSITTQTVPSGPRSQFTSNTQVTIPDLSTRTSTILVSGFAGGLTASDVKVNLTINHTFASDLVLTLIAPDGTQVLLAQNEPSAFFPGQNYTNTTFDDSSSTPISSATAPFTGSFKPLTALAELRGHALNGTWTLVVTDDVSLDSGVLTNWSLNIQPGITVTSLGNGNPLDQNANGVGGESSGDTYAAPSPTGGSPFVAPYKQDTLPLIVPGPHVVSTHVPGAPVTSDNLVLNGTVSAIDVTFDRNMDPTTFDASKVLRIQGPAGLVGGPFTVTPNPLGTDPDPSHPRTFRVGFPTQQLSGTYTVALASSIRSQSGFAIDANQNAGVDVLLGTSTTAPVPVTYNNADSPLSLPPGKTVASKIVIPDDFPIQGLTLTLNITDAFDPDLTAVLVAPDGTTIPLFSGVGTTGNGQNFTNTIFDDNANTPIVNGGPPFFGRFRPQQPLGVLNGSSSVKGPGGTGTGNYLLEITNASATNTGTLNGWSLTLQKPTSGSGLGELVADQSSLSFRIFTMAPTNPLASTTWTSVGPASIGGSRSGRIGGLAIDPSDPSGNTVYVAGASGGVWKTTDFLTTNAGGPTYIPLTDFGATFGVNVGGVAVFGRNNDPNQSEIYVATGEGDAGSTGVGVLRSMDGGATWTLLDSTDNTLPFAARDHAFVGSSAFKILVDPRPTPDGNAIIYMALSGNNGGIWRSTDSGQTWGVIDPTTGKRTANRAGQATDVALDPNSGPVDAVSNPTGNLQVVYGAFRGEGVFISPNQGQVWSLMAGGVGDPLIQDPSTNPPKPVPVNNLGVSPNGAFGRIVLAKPALVPASAPNAALKNFLYQGWLYAVVVTPDSHLQGLYLTKDNGQNWTKIRIPNLPPVNNVIRAVPSNDTSQTDYDPLGNPQFAQGNYDVSLSVDPTNPAVVYLGGTADGQPSGLLRIDTTALIDPHSFYLADNQNDGGTLSVNATSGVALKQNPLPGASGFDPRLTPTLNLVRDPSNPLGGNATFYVNNITSFANTGAGATWIPFDQGVSGSTDQHRVVTMIDPVTGHGRLIFGDDQGVFTAVDLGNGTLDTGIGSQASPNGPRNGNLQITQFYYGAAQPSSAAAQIAGALFYGSAQDDGAPFSDPNVLNNGNISWSGPGGDATGVATDGTGTGTLYQYHWPCCGGNLTDFFQVNGVGRTNGLIQTSGGASVPDPQWPFTGGFNFAVNPINGNQITMGSGAGRLFRTEDQGKNWLVIADPGVLDGSVIQAPAFGAPDVNAGSGSLDNFIYAGTQAGHIFVTFTGGGANGNNWLNITNGDLAGNTSPVMAIVTNPTRGSREAYAVTANGVYTIADSNPGSGQTWKRITGNVFQITHQIFGAQNPSQDQTETQLKFLTSIAADWRYVLPDNPGTVGGPTHPVLYVGGDGGVYISTDKGKTWSPFPSTLPNTVATQPNPPGAGGGLPDAQVNSLSMSLGNIDPTTGRAVAAAGDPNVLLASTYGRGSFAIRLAPTVVPNSNAPGTPNNWLYLDPSTDTGVVNNDGVTNNPAPIVDGTSEQSAFGNTVTIALFDLSNPNNPVPIPITGSNQTDANGHFQVHIAPGYFTTDGVKTIGVQATDQSGTKGDIAILRWTLDTTAPVAPLGLHLDTSTDSFPLTFNVPPYTTDQYTWYNNGPNGVHPSPLFDVTGVEPGATVVLLRNGVEVGRATNTAGGTVQVADTNGGNGKIPDSPVGTPADTPPPAGNPYNYTAYQIDAANNTGPQNTTPDKVIIDTTAPLAPTQVVLDPTTDSGTYNGDDYTWDNNSTAHPAPLLDVFGIEPNAVVQLFRTDSNGNTVLVNTVTAGPSGGMVQVPDINGGNGRIPDSPVGVPPDTAPPAGHPYIYTALQVDIAGNVGPQNSNGLPVIIDTRAPITPNKIVLEGASDSGTSNGDQYTYNNNGSTHAPVFDVSGIEPHATVQLIRAPMLNGVIGTPVVVNTIVDTAGGTVAIADINGGNGPIPDSPVGTPADTAPPAGNPYVYTAIQIDLAGNTSKDFGFGNQGAIVIDGTDSDDHGSFGSGVNQGGWLYMQKVLPLIAPNVTNTNRIIVALGADPTDQSQIGAAAAIDSAFTQGPLPAQGWSVVYVNGPANIGTFLSGGVANAFNRADQPIAGGITLDKTGILYITTANQAVADLTDTELAVVNQHGQDISDYVNGGGGLFAQAESPFTSGVPTWGWLTNIFPGITVTDLGGGGTGPNDIQITPAGQAAFPGLTPADLSTGPWHNYFDGNLGALVPAVTDLDQPGGTRRNLILTSQGVKLAPIEVIIDSTPPVAPGLALEPGSDSGTYNNDQVTQDNNGNPFPAPVFDAANVEPNAIVKLFRAPVVNGLVGTPVLVNTLTEGATGGTLPIPDVNGGNGKIADGTYVYTTQQIDLAGNVGPISGGVTVIVDATAPAVPRPVTLDPASDTGTFNNDQVTKDNNGNPYPAPVFDVGSVEPRATVKLYRAPVINGVVGAAVLVNTLVDTAGGTVAVPDINGNNTVIPDGTYAYTAQQTDLAGNVGPMSAAVRVTINTQIPLPSPLPPPDLEAASDTGTFNNDNITQDNNGNPFPAPVFDVGTASQSVDKFATVQLYRAAVNPNTGLPGTPVLVNTLTNTAGGVIPIADINGGNGVIPDGTYVYTAQLTSLAGVPGAMSRGLTVVIKAAAPAVPQPFRLDAASDTGVSSSDGITQITLFHFPVFDASGVLPGATLNLFRAPVDAQGNVGASVPANSLVNTAGGLIQISDPTSLPDGKYVYTVQQVDLEGNAGAVGGAITVVYDTGQPPTPPSPVLDPASDTGTKGDNITSNASPFLDVTVAVTGLELNSSLTLVRDGTTVASTPYNVVGGVVKIQDPGPVPFGVHTYQAFLTDLAGNKGALGGPVTINFANDQPGTLTLDPASDSGVKGDNVTNVTDPTFDVAGVAANSTLRLLRNGLVVASLPTGAGGNLMITDPGPLNNGSFVYTSQQVDALGHVSPSSPPLTVKIDTTVPPAPNPVQLDPASDSGAKGDNVTNVTSPAFDVSAVVAGATVTLYRNGTAVATLTAPSAGTVMITDPGPLASATYVYTVRQTSPSGNPSQTSSALSVTVDTTVPAGPALALDPVSDSGTKGDNLTNVLNPKFDASGLVAGSTLQLFRNGLLVNTVHVATAGTAVIQDPGPLFNGQFTFTAVQTTQAGTPSVVGPPLVITIDTAPPPIPTTPTLALAASADSGIKGDNITNARRPSFTGTADPGVVVTLFNGAGTQVATTTSDVSGNFTFTLTSNLLDGTYTYKAQATDASNHSSALSAPLAVQVVTVAGDYNGDGKTDVAIFRRTNPGLLQWFVQNVAALTAQPFGAGSLDVPLAGDFDGDGKVDLAIYRPSTAQWFVEESSTGYVSQALGAYGWAGVDVPMPGNYSGSGLDIRAVFRPNTDQFFIDGQASPVTVVSPAKPTDIPAPANYDNTGRAEPAVYRPGTSTWYIVGPNNTVHTVFFGGPQDVPVPGAYDATAANHADEVAVFRPSTGQWFIKGPNGTRILQFQAGDIPAPGDYDGIGVTEAAVFRPGTGQWFVQGPNDTAPRLLTAFGWANHDIPTLSPYRYRAVGNSGNITAFGAPSGGFNFAASAQSLSSGGNGSAPAVFAAPATPSRPQTPPGGVAAITSARVRPNQGAAVTAQALRRLHQMNLIDHALEVISIARSHRRHHPLG